MITELIESGLALVEVPLGEKGPTSIGWNLAQNVIKRAEDVARLRGKNFGLAHAYCSPVPTCAIDIDDYRLARKWLSKNGFGLKAELLRPESVVFTSGQPYKIKLLYKLPGGVGPIPTKKILSAENETILEFRCATRDGLTVQDLIPPSMHPSGSRYKWLGCGSPFAIPTIPYDLLGIWQKLLITSHAQQSFNARRVITATPRNMALVIDALTYVDADCSYDVWRNVVWALLSTHWDSAEQLACRWSQTAQHRFDQTKFQLLVDSYDPFIDNGFTLGTVFHYARIGGWNG